MSTPNSYTGASKKNKSLSWKLSFSHMRQQIGSYIKVDLFIILLFTLALIIWSEATAEKAYQKYFSQPTNTTVSQMDEDYISLEESNVGAGLKFFEAVEDEGIVRRGSYRQIITTPAISNISEIFSGPGNYFAYKVYLPTANDNFLAVTIHWEIPLAFFMFSLTILLLYQLFSLPFIIVRSRNRIRKALDPIYQLTATAQTISSGDISIPISGTIDALNTITGTHLDHRISISDEREELQGLALAINSMLDRLDQSYQAQLQFVSDASHELRTPISIIQGYAQLINRWGKDDPKTLEESIDAIQSETESMQILVEQLLFLARSDNQSLKLNTSTVNLSNLMKEVLEETRMVNEDYTITDNIQPNIFMVADPQLIKQATRILVDNAIKYTPESGRISLGLEQENNNISIHVSDNGVGLSPENLSNLFNRFWRADSSRTRKTGGTGLGLTIAKWIVESHNGFINVVSREDLGSKFSICLPISLSANPPEDITPLEDMTILEDITPLVDITPPRLVIVDTPKINDDVFSEFKNPPSLEDHMGSSFSTKDIS